MNASGLVYIIPPSPYDTSTITLGRFATQQENLEFVGSQQVSASGTMKVFSIGNKKKWQLSGGASLTFAEYIKVCNYLKTKQGDIESVYIDTEGGRKLCTIQATFNRNMASNNANNTYNPTYILKEV